MTHFINSTLITTTFIFNALTSQAAVLTGSGQLPFPSPNDPLSWVGPAYTSLDPNTQEGDWSAPAAAPWIGGEFTITSASGLFPNAPSIGLFRYDFTGMTNGGGLLPVGTYFWLGDVDDGSGNNEVYEMQAFDGSGALLSEWLDEPIHVHGAGVVASSMPDYTWDAGSMSYIFDGNFVPGNPSIGIIMENNQEMAYLNVNKLDFSYNFAINAPLATVPVPAAIWLFGSALIGLAGIKRKK